MTLRLNNGRTFRILKIFRDVNAMRAALARNGLKTDVRETARYFQHGIGGKVAD
jgi:hypothetical protein